MASIPITSREFGRRQTAIMSDANRRAVFERLAVQDVFADPGTPPYQRMMKLVNQAVIDEWNREHHVAVAAAVAVPRHRDYSPGPAPLERLAVIVVGTVVIAVSRKPAVEAMQPEVREPFTEHVMQLAPQSWDAFRTRRDALRAERSYVPSVANVVGLGMVLDARAADYHAQTLALQVESLVHQSAQVDARTAELHAARGIDNWVKAKIVEYQKQRVPVQPLEEQIDPSLMVQEPAVLQQSSQEGESVLVA